MKTNLKNRAIARVIILFSLLSIQLPLIEAQTSNETPTVEIENEGKDLKVKWAKPYTKKGSQRLKARVSPRSYTGFPINSHLHVIFYDDSGEPLVERYKNLSHFDFRHTVTRGHRDKTFYFDSKTDSEKISSIFVQSCENRHEEQESIRQDHNTE